MHVFRTALRTAVVAVAAVGTVCLVGISPAAASPNGCSVGANSDYAWAYCSGGTGRYQAITRCDAPWAFDYTVEGPIQRVGSGLQSHAYCGLQDRPYDYYIATYNN